MKLKTLFVVFAILILSHSPVRGDFAAPPYDGGGFSFRGRLYPSLPFRTTTYFSFSPFSKMVEGRWKILIILVEYSDYSHRDDIEIPSSPDYFHDMFAGGPHYPFRSMNDFYLENSGGRFGIGEVDVYGWYTLPHTRQYYACNATACDPDSNAYGFRVRGDYWEPAGALEVVDDALNMAMNNDPSLDLMQYDNDGDGMPESIVIIHAGEGGESDRTDPMNIWSHRNIYTLSTTAGTGFSGNIVYVMGPEMFSENDTMPVRMGVFAHEFGHALGLPDLYDTDYSSCGDGPYSLMAYGVHTGTPPGSNPYPLDAWLKMKLGWVYPVDITINTCGRLVYPIQLSNVVYRYNPSGGSEYFLIAFRKDYGFDHQMFSNLSPHWKGAVYIWHVDESKGNGFLNPIYPYNTQECVPENGNDCSKEHYALSLIQADGLYQLERTKAGGGCSIPDWNDLYQSGDYFGVDSDPDSDWWNGTPSNLTVDVVRVTDNYAKINFIVDPDFKLSPPQIFSIPPTSAQVGKKYVYKVEASGYGLSYELIEAPEGMRIDPARGIITWYPRKSDLGYHKVVVKVENCGGEDTQEYVLVVYEPESQGCSCRSGGSEGDLIPILFSFIFFLFFRKVSE